jgi:hypothetical protein
VGRHAGEHLDRGKFALQLGQARPLIGSNGSRPLRFVKVRRPRRTLSFLNFSTMRLLHVLLRWATLAGGSHAPRRLGHENDVTVRRRANPVPAQITDR